MGHTLIVVALCLIVTITHGSEFSLGFILRNVTVGAVDVQNTRAYVFSGPAWGGTSPPASMNYTFFNYAAPKPSIGAWFGLPGVADIQATGLIDLETVLFDSDRESGLALGVFTYNAYPFPGDDEIVVPYSCDDGGMLHIQKGAHVPSLGINPGLTSWTFPPNQLVVDTGTTYSVFNLTRNADGLDFWNSILQASYGASLYTTSPISFDPLRQITAAITSGPNDVPTLKYAFVGSRISPEPLIFGKFPEWGTAPSFAFTESFIIVTPWVSRTVAVYLRPSETSANNTEVARLQMPSYGINSVFQDGDSLYIISGGTAVNQQDTLQVLKYSTRTWSLLDSFSIACPSNCPLNNVGYGSFAAVDKANRIMLIDMTIGITQSTAVVNLRY